MFNVAPTKVAAPDVPVVVRVIAFCLPLKVVQSVLDSNPFCEPVAVAIAKVIVPLVVTGVAPIVTPLVADDKPTLVTLPVPYAVESTVPSAFKNCPDVPPLLINESAVKLPVILTLPVN